MLGMVFTEFLEMVETTFSAETVDQILDATATPHGGAYTAVGNYPHQEIIALAGALATHTGHSVDVLVHTFGEYLLGRFAATHPTLFATHQNLFDFLASIDGVIHVHVRRLYTQARPPRFVVEDRTGDRLVLRYESIRGMEALAAGLIAGAAAHYGETVTVHHAPVTDHPVPATTFIVERVG